MPHTDGPVKSCPLKNDRVWADMMGEKPMRRTWENYLEEDVNV